MMKNNAFLKLGVTATLTLALGSTLALSSPDASAKGFHPERYSFVQVQDKEYLRDTGVTTDWHTNSTDVKKLSLDNADFMYWQLSVDKDGIATLPGKYPLLNSANNPVEADIILNVPPVNYKPTAMKVHIDKEGHATVTQSEKLPQGQYVFVPKNPKMMAMYYDESEDAIDLGYKKSTVWKDPDFSHKRNNNNLLIENVPLLNMARLYTVAQNANEKEGEFNQHSDKVMAYFTGISFMLVMALGTGLLISDKRQKNKEKMGEKIFLHTNAPDNNLTKAENKIQSLRQQAFTQDAFKSDEHQSKPQA